MTDEQEIMRRQAEGMRAMSEEMARRQLEAVKGMQNAWPAEVDCMRGQADRMTNVWRQATDAMPIAQLPPKPRPTLWARFMLWIWA